MNKFQTFIRKDSARICMLLLIIVVECIVFSSTGYFFTASNIFDALRASVEIGLAALGMTFVIMTTGIDLSVGSLLALVSVTIGFTYQAGCPFVLSLLLGLLVGIAGGAFNGALIVYGRLHPFVVTLGTFSFYRGIAYAATNAGAVSVFPDGYALAGRAYILGVVPVQVVVFVLLTILIWILSKKTPFGTYVTAMGYNEEAARFSGVQIRKIKMLVYILIGFLVAAAAIIYTSRVSTARGNAAIGMELNVIAAVVLGGTDIKGGKGTIAGTFLGVVILAFLKNGLAMLSIRGDWALCVTGIVLLLGILLNRALEVRQE